MGLYFGQTKDKALKHFKSFKEFIEIDMGNKLKRLCSDNGGEYINKYFKDFCASHGIIMETMAPYSPAKTVSQNGLTEPHLNMHVQ